MLRGITLLFLCRRTLLRRDAGLDRDVVPQVDEERVRKDRVGHIRVAEDGHGGGDGAAGLVELEVQTGAETHVKALCKSSIENDIKRENANIDGDTAMGTMLKYGSEGAKQFYEMFILDSAHAAAHRDGDIHIHDLDFLTLTTTCCQIDLLKLFRDGFSTGHGFLREPNDIRSYAALACIAIQSNQNDQHGGQSVPNFDYSMAPGVRKTFRKLFRSNLAKALEVFGEDDNNEVDARELTERVEQETGKWACLAGDNGYDEAVGQQPSSLCSEIMVSSMAMLRSRAVRVEPA